MNRFYHGNSILATPVNGEIRDMLMLGIMYLWAPWPTPWVFAPAPSQEAGSVKISMILAPGDPEKLLLEVLAWREPGGHAMPLLIAEEPGPLVMAQGLKLIPNQVPPKLTVPDLLLISSFEREPLSHVLVAFLRRCLAEGKRVWVVGEHFTPALKDVDLEPGQSIEKVALDDLGRRLKLLRLPIPK